MNPEPDGEYDGLDDNATDFEREQEAFKERW